MLATTFAEAAGVAGPQKWGLVLSSSARVSHVTYQTLVGCGTLSWSRSMGQVGTLASSSPMRNHGEVASSQFSGMLNGLQNAALSRPMPSRAWQCCTIGTTWPPCFVLATGSLNRKIPLFPEGSPPAPAWLPIQLSLPRPESGSWVEVAKSHSLICRKMNRLSNWRRRMPVLRWQSPGLGHCALSWVPSIWKASLELLLWWGPDVPISTCTMTSATPLLMKLSLICWNKTVAWQDRISRRLLLLKSFRTMLPTFTKYDGYILLWWTCGGRGSTILPGQEMSLISFGIFRMVRILVEWVHFDLMALNLRWGAVVLLMALLWTVLSFLAILCGRKERSGRMSY